MNNKQIVVAILEAADAPISLRAIESRASWHHDVYIPAASVRRIVNELEDEVSIGSIYVRGYKFVAIETGFPTTWGAANGNSKPLGVSRFRGETLAHGVPFAAADGSVWGLK